MKIVVKHGRTSLEVEGSGTEVSYFLQRYTAPRLAGVWPVGAPVDPKCGPSPQTGATDGKTLRALWELIVGLDGCAIQDQFPKHLKDKIEDARDVCRRAVQVTGA